MPATHDSLLCIHIPKTAGNSIRAFPFVRLIGHRPVYHQHDATIIDETRMNIRAREPRYAEWTSFCVVRHPVDRFLSAYSFLLQGGGQCPLDRSYQCMLQGLGNLETVLIHLVDLKRRVVHFIDQQAFVCDPRTGTLLVNHVIRFETMAAELEAMDPRFVRIPHKNKTRSTSIDRRALTTEQVQHLERIYAADFARFGYPLSSSS